MMELFKYELISFVMLLYCIYKLFIYEFIMIIINNIVTKIKQIPI